MRPIHLFTLIAVLVLSACAPAAAPAPTAQPPLAATQVPTTVSTSAPTTAPTAPPTATPTLIIDPTATFAPTAAPIPATTVAETDIWNRLRTEPGLVILLRHAQTTPGTGDPPGFRLDDCATQRNLSEAGRTDAAQIGAALRARQIPVAGVLSSQWCRCLDTAALLALGPVTPYPPLNSFFEDATTQPQQTAAVTERIRAHRETAGALVMVTHMVNISALTAITAPQGGAVVVRAAADGRLEVLGQLTEWPA